MSERLCQSVLPRHYDLHFYIDFDTFTFHGRELVSIHINGQQSSLRLYSEDITIETLTLHCNNQPVSCSFDITEGELIIMPDHPLKEGDYRLDTLFHGQLGDELSGLYRSRYIDKNGSEAYLVTTQFEAPYARKAFPCFDEPSFKTAFSVSLDIPTHMTGISNMPVESEVISGERKTVRFAPTPPMSTYLLYMGAGAFDYIEKVHDGCTIRVYGIGGKSEQGEFALNFAADALAFFERYSGIAYPLPKLDLLAIPDFAAGAMENWGAITFREVLLFVDENASSLPVKKRVAEVVAHELWHQWSGNLVTMQWWNDLWLNEAFATYQAFRAVNQFFPEWHIWDDFIDSDTKNAFSMDMLSSTHPIAATVNTPNEVEEIFDYISYGKGASVLRMIEGYTGEESFRNGVAAYLKTFKYRNATAEDLWETLEHNSGQPVRNILITWITKTGFPLCILSEGKEGVSIRQQRFAAGAPSNDENWPIPLTWISDNRREERLFTTHKCTLSTGDSWIKCNAGQTGFYRTLYDKASNKKLYEAIRIKELHEHDRWGILNDLWACVLAGYTELEELLGVMNWYETEVHTMVLRELASQCRVIQLYLHLEDRGEALFRRYRTPFVTALENTGWQKIEGEAPLTGQLRSLAIAYLVRAGDDTVNQKAQNLAQSYLDGSEIDPDIREACLSALSNTKDRDLFERVRKAYEEKDGSEEKVALLGTLGDFPDSHLLIDYADYALSDAVRRQDLRRVFTRIAHNPASPKVFFDWIQANWQVLKELHKSHFAYMSLLQALITTAFDNVTLDSIRDFLDRNSEGYEKTISTAFEKASLYIAFRERESRTLHPSRTKKI